jgi:hypothetical protein
MKVGGGFLGFLILGGRPLAARRLARMRFLYCFQSQPRNMTVHMAMTAELETMAEIMGVLARWLFEFAVGERGFVICE